MSEKDEKEKARTLKKAYLGNLALKLREGKALTEREFEHLRILSEEKQPQTDPPLPCNPEKGRGPDGTLRPQSEVGIPERLRIKRYTLSEAAQQQRKNAARQRKPKLKGNKNAWKHGKYAQGFINNFIKPCKSTCNSYPCEIILDGGTKPGDICLDKSEILTTFRAIQKALTDKDNAERYRDINEIVALKVAGAIKVVDMLIEDIVRDNTIFKSEKFDRDGNIIGHEIRPHPSLLTLLKLISDLYCIQLLQEHTSFHL